jgi:hypothetical protein
MNLYLSQQNRPHRAQAEAADFTVESLPVLALKLALATLAAVLGWSVLVGGTASLLRLVFGFAA